jgi:hypothetical protein
MIMLSFCCVLYSQDITRTVDNSKFITQSIPDNMAAGENYNGIVTFENTGTTTWYPNEYKLRIIAGPSVTMGTWGISEMPITQIIEPGKTISIELKLIAPSAEGTHLFQSQLMHGSNMFGETSKEAQVIVSARTFSGEVFNSSAFVDQTVPTYMVLGNKYKVSISMTNTGKTAWTPGKYRLVLLEPTGVITTSNYWGSNSIELTDNIGPGSSKVFSFEIAPTQAGVYPLQWRMSSSDGGLFGDATKSVSVEVKAPPIEKNNEGRRGKE